MPRYTQIMYQIVFSTYRRERTMIKSGREQVFQYIGGVLRNKKCKLLQINGVEDHLHILTDLHPTIALSDLIKDIKVSSHKLIKDKKIFPQFNGWQEGYGAFTYSIDRREVLINYIKNQEIHHAHLSYLDELKELLQKHGLELDERFLD
jgi:putative transposase